MTPRFRRSLAALCLVLSAAFAGTAAAQVRSDFARTFGDELTKGIQRGDADAVSRALIRGYNPSKRYAQGMTPLMMAALEGQPEIAEMLLGYGANIRTRDKLGNSALIYAAAGGHFEAVEVLLGRGADPTLTDHTGRTALECARQNRHRAIVKMLEKLGS